MTRKNPFFITASLLFATVAVALPDIDLESVTEEPVAVATTRSVAGAPHTPAVTRTKP